MLRLRSGQAPAVRQDQSRGVLLQGRRPCGRRYPRLGAQGPAGGGLALIGRFPGVSGNRFGLARAELTCQRSGGRRPCGPLAWVISRSTPPALRWPITKSARPALTLRLSAWVRIFGAPAARAVS